jgi:hypothetical protein
VPPVEGQNNLFIWFSLLVAAVVVTVSVEVCAVLPLSVTEAGLRLQLAGSLAAVGLMEQLRFTVPEYPFVPARLMVEVFPVVAPGLTVIAPLLPAAPLAWKVGCPVTVSETVVVAFNAPAVPVTVTVTGPPSAAVLLAESVSTWVPAAVPAAKLAVTPLGNPVAPSVTVPVNPPTSLTVIVLVPLLFCVTDTLVGETDSLKLGVTG